MKKAFRRIVRMPRKYQIGFGALALVLLVVLFRMLGSGAPQASQQEAAHVTVASVASLSDQAGPLPVTGKVTSVSKANILAVSSGEIVSLSRSLGDRVGAGSVIASFENSSQRAAVLQAQGSYEGAQAALAKISGTTAENTGITSTQAATAAANAAVAARSALRSAYAALDDAVNIKADALISNPHSNIPRLNFDVSDSQLALNIQNQRVGLDALLESVRGLGTGEGDINAEAALMISKARTVESFLNTMVEALNKAITTPNFTASTQATYQASISGARSQVLASISSLTSAKSAYDSAVSSASVAGNSADAGLASDIASAQANVKAALGALNAAQANLEKTIIRAPISGTIVSLSIRRGDYVSAFSQVAQVSNPGALVIETYVTSADAKTLAVGGDALVNGTVEGVVTFIAPALDPTTGKIQVKVGLPEGERALTDGDTVTVSLERAATGSTQSSSKKEITIPIAAAKLTPSGPVVFTVSSSTLSARPVTFGTVLGGQVVIEEGLSLEMEIVTDARGLTDGQRVVVDSD